jgi:hypothetical protein
MKELTLCLAAAGEDDGAPPVWRLWVCFEVQAICIPTVILAGQAKCGMPCYATQHPILSWPYSQILAPHWRIPRRPGRIRAGSLRGQHVPADPGRRSGREGAVPDRCPLHQPPRNRAGLCNDAPPRGSHIPKAVQNDIDFTPILKPFLNQDKQTLPYLLHIGWTGSKRVWFSTARMRHVAGGARGGDVSAFEFTFNRHCAPACDG